MEYAAGRTRLLCERCSKTFKSIVTFRSHVEVCYQSNAEPRFKCEICSKRFRTEAQYTRHSYYTHTKRRFSCEEPGCGRLFPSKHQLAQHSIIHSSDRPHVCPFPGCGYRARTEGRLLQHRLVHGEGRRFPCEYCDYSATTSSNLRRHARLHTGAKPYLCPHCPHRTCDIDALAKHVLESGRHPGLPLYVCPWCSQGDHGSTPVSGECVGFNATGLAWRHLMAEHADHLFKSEAFKRIGRSADGILLERDVTVLLGIYRADLDSTRPPEGALVRQPAVVSRHRRKLRV